jgi:hypothetical protein
MLMMVVHVIVTYCYISGNQFREEAVIPAVEQQFDWYEEKR